MNTGFNAMAVNGQVAGKSMGDLAVSTGTFFKEMKLGSVVAGQFGVLPEESNKAFAKLTETFGGTGEAIDGLGKNWESLALIAQVSGLGMTAMTDLVAQNFKKVGGTMEEAMEAAKNQVAEMSNVTGELNARFGDGSVNTKAFAASINELAFGASFMNQNSRMLTDTLKRELQVQLALGKAPEAAMEAAKKNIEMAGKVNLVGITQFRDALQEEFDAIEGEDAQKKFIEDLGERFGSQGEVIGNMLQTDTLKDNLFGFQQAVENSTGLRDKMLEDMRASAAGGDVGALLAKGLGIKEAEYMVAEARLLTTKIKDLNKDGKVNKEAAADLFGPDWEKDDKAKAFIAKAGKGKASMQEMHKEFREMPGIGPKKLAEDAAKGGVAAKQPWEKYVAKNIKAGWFAGVTNSFKVIAGLLATLPISLGVVILAASARGGLAKFLKNLKMPGRGAAKAAQAAKAAKAASKAAPAAGRFARAMPTFAKAGGKIAGVAGKVGSMVAGPLKIFGRLLGKAGPIGLAISAIAGFGLGMAQASEIFKDVDVGAAEYAAAGIGGAVNMLTMGLIDTADAAHTAMDLGGWMKNLVGLGDDPLAPTAMDRGDSPEALEAVEKHRAMLRARGATPPPTSTSNVPEDTDVSGGADGGSGGAVATGTVSGNSLILEVTNWDQVHAQAVDAAASG
jgi:hypothetical protein